MKPIKVLSLFDGISTGMLALERAGIEVDEYFAYEIEPVSISVSKKNYPQIIQCGSVIGADFSQYKGIDLLIGGSPCQGFSFAGKQLNFEDPRSKLFFEFVRALKECQPKYFLLENVKMKQEFQDIISDYLGVKPVFINSSDFSAQDRKRLYWTNIPITEYGNNTLTIEDILEPEVDCKYIINSSKQVKIIDNEIDKLKRKKIAYINKDSQANRIYSIYGKSVCLMGEAGGLGAKTGLYALPCLTPDREEKRQNGRRFKPPHSKFYTLTTIDRHGVLTNNFIRKLTPMECERLQTLPDNYTYGFYKNKEISDNQRWRMLGNGWTADVIAHIMRGMN